MRRPATSSFAALLVLLATACGAAPSATGGDDPIKVAVVLVNSGAFAYSSGEVRAGAEVAAETLGKRGGRPVELLFVESDGTPANTVQAVTRAVRQDGATAVTGWFTSATAAAVSSQASRLGAVVVDPVAQATALTGADCSSHYFRVAANGAMFANAVQRYASTSGLKDWNVLAMDYSYGHDAAGQFTSKIKAQGGTVGKKVFPPLGTTDFATFITQLKGKRAEGLFVVSGGADAITFAKQAQDFDLLGEYRSVLGQGFIVPSLLPKMGDAVIGVRDTVSWTPEADAPSAATFSTAFKRKKGTEAWYLPADVHVAIEMIAKAADTAGSAEAEKLRAALQGLDADTVAGRVTMRAEDHQLRRPLYGIEVKRKGSGLAAETTESLPAGAVTPPADPACSL